jgi:Zn finger protein HypA/HybF involved in hydrogenase expression
MPRFKCNDPDCEYYGIEELIPCVRFIWNDKNQRLEATEAECPKCGNQRDTVKEDGDIVIPWFKAENAKNYQNKHVSKKRNQFNY